MLALYVVIAGASAEPVVASAASPAVPGRPLLADVSLVAVLGAFPLDMALATGVEAPSNAIAQLPQLRDRGRRRFGRGTLWLMVAIVGGLTLSLAALTVGLHAGVPGPDSTLLADVARQAVGGGVPFAAFQLFSALLLLAAAASARASSRRSPGWYARLSRRDGRRAALLANLAGAALVSLVLVLNLTRLDSAIALLSSCAVALYLWRAWVARGRPGGVAHAPR